MGPVAALLPDGKRLHLQHGPIDLIIGADGDRDRAFQAARARFETVLAELVQELATLRARSPSVPASGQIANKMLMAAAHFDTSAFVTPMAAVAGAVADTILKAMTDAANLSRAYVNNGGDIAIHLTPGARFKMAMAGHDGRGLGQIDIGFQDGIRGIATSGRHGRSLSLGIADSVTVLARSAAVADVAATLIANAVDLPGHPAITRKPAALCDDASDLGDQLVVTGCGTLSQEDTAQALANGAARARQFQNKGDITSACLFLNGQTATLHGTQFSITQGRREYA